MNMPVPHMFPQIYNMAMRMIGNIYDFEKGFTFSIHKDNRSWERRAEHRVGQIRMDSAQSYVWLYHVFEENSECKHLLVEAIESYLGNERSDSSRAAR